MSKIKKDYNSYIKFGIYLIVVLLINIVSVSLFFKVDLTSNKLYSLSKASIDAVSTLKEPMTVKVFFSKNLPAPWNNIEPYLHDLLAEYKSNASEDFNYRFYPIDSRQGELSKVAAKNRKEAADYGINPINLYKAAQEEQKSLLAYMGMVIIHGDVVEKLPVIESTDNLEYKITTAIKKLNSKISSFLNMEGNISVVLVQSSSLQKLIPFLELKGFELIKAKVEKIVGELNNKAYGKLDFKFVDPSITPLDSKLSEKFGRFKMSWPRKEFPSGKVLEAGEGYLAIGIMHKDKSVEMKLIGTRFNPAKFSEEYYITEEKDIKEFINENITNVMNINDDIGYLTSHGTKPLAPNLPPEYRHLIKPKPGELKILGSILNQNYNVRAVDLKKEGIPKGIDTLIIVGPKENFTDWELFQIDQFLMEGHSLAVFSDSFKELKQQNQYQRGQAISIPNKTGLEKLLNHYGLKQSEAFAMDSNCFINRDRNRGDNPVYIAPIIQNNNINHSIPFLDNITGFVMFKNSPIIIDKKIIEDNGIDVKTLFKTSDESWELKGPVDQRALMFSAPPSKKEDMKQFELALIAEGKFPSYFNGRDLPKKPIKNEDKEKEKKKDIKKPVMSTDLKSGKEFISVGRKAKVFLLGSSEMLTDQILRAPIGKSGQSQIPLFLVNLFDYLNNKEDIAILRSKVQRFNPIEKTKAGTRDFIKFFNIVGVPIIFIIIGIFVFVLRQKRRKKIAELFKN